MTTKVKYAGESDKTFLENLSSSKLPAHTDRAEKGIITNENPQRNEKEVESTQAFQQD